MPRLLGGVVRGIVDQQTDMVVVGEGITSAMLDTLDVGDARVMVIGVDDTLRTESIDRLRLRHPGLRILMLDVAGRFATMVEPDGRRCHVPEVSADALLALLREPPMH